MNSDDRLKATRAIAAERAPFERNNQMPLEELYGRDVFSLRVMAKQLSEPTFNQLQQAIKQGTAIDAAVAQEVAEAMKDWALSKGATHYTHWFLPLTGYTAEKHDSFVDPDNYGGLLINFSAKNLILGEPDASSFPSGGLRSTFEARGYTAWDPTSPAFIKHDKNGATLCIPTAFCSYTGEVLDKKTPLLRSIQALSHQVRRILKCFNLPTEERPIVTLGAEQEYFLIDKRFYTLRPDLIQTGRTLFGARPPKHQQLEDHYFGVIKPRILDFMSDVDRELWRLGIPAKTRHNEVAPAQFELAPMFEELNLAVDHNMLVMEVLRHMADRHGLVCLLHEKPFAGVNGSGKHNNWSISAGKINLLNPGSDPRQNALFLTTLCAIIQAVDRHADLLRSATAGAGNDHRLGANEAPPAIISIFLGDQLTDIIDQIESGTTRSSKKNALLQIGVDALPALPKDATDRNRTSPFAFTGAKFEFRAPGSSQSCAGPNIILNTIVCESLDEIATELEKSAPESFNANLQKLLQNLIRKHKRIIFNGDNYSAEWLQEANRRGLVDLRTSPEALDALLKPENIALFEKYKVFSRSETNSRYEVFIEEYKRKILIEGELSLTMARTVIFPAVNHALAQLAGAANALQQTNISANAAQEQLSRIAPLADEFIDKCALLETALSTADSASIINAMSELRRRADSLELLIDDQLWPLPKYREMLFIY